MNSKRRKIGKLHIITKNQPTLSEWHCFAINDNDRGEFENYEIEAEMLSLESNEGQNSGYLGIAFNYLNEHNYDFVYLEYV